MDSSVQVAVIGGAVSVIIAMFSFTFTNWQKRRDEVHERKFAYYKEFMEALSGLAINPKDETVAKRFANACNTIVLIAPQSVITVLTAFQNELKQSTQDFSKERQNILVNSLLLELRYSLGIRGDNPKQFSFSFLSVGGKNLKSPLKR